MPINLAKLLAAATLPLAIVGAADGQTYRQSYPLPDGSDLGGLSVNLSIANPTDAQLQQIVNLGAKYVRFEFTWDGIEKSAGVYDWTATDKLMSRTKSYGLRVMGLVAYSNSLYTSTGAPNTPTSRAAYAKFAAACAARYAHRGVIWEIYNEPNLDGWWPNPNGTDYALLSNAAAAAIRGVSSDEWIIGLTTQSPADWNMGYITDALNGGILNGLDGLGFHPYTQSNPETKAPEWANARTLVETYRPAGKSIALLTGEVGYSRLWSGITTTVQATYMVREVLYDLCQGIGFTNLSNNADDAVADTDWHSACGLTTAANNTPYPAYTAIQRMTTALKGYKFSKRLTLPTGSADYCMLFTNPADPSDCKVVLWTTGASHAVTVPSSAVAFASQNFTSGATGSATATSAGLTVTATTEATLYDSSAANPLLAIAGAWDKLPAAITLANRADAVNQLDSIVVSGAWANVPDGTVLKIQETATSTPGYVRPALTTTLTDLPNLALDSASVQAFFNQLGALQDDAAPVRTLKFTLQLPDGSSAVQTATVSRKQPMAIYPTTPQNWALTLRVDNLSGAPFTGTVKATSGIVSATQSVSFGQGETYKMVMFPTLIASLIGSDLNFSLYDGNGNVVDGSKPAIQSIPSTVYRSPNFVLSSGYGITTGGLTSTPCTAKMSLGTANWSFLTGGATMDLDYSFGRAAGSRYVSLLAPTGLLTESFSKMPVSLGMWVYGDNSGNFIRAQFLDSSNQTFLITYGAINWTGWKWVQIPVLNNYTSSWGGANDGIVHGAVRLVAPFTLDSNQLGTSGRVSVIGITVVGQK